MRPTQSFVRNDLLSALSPEAYDLLRPHLEPVPLDRGLELVRAGERFEHVHFIEHGIGSMLVGSAATGRVEAGIFGREGTSGMTVVLGGTHAAHTILIQVAGDGYRIDTGVFGRIVADARAVREPMLAYVQTMMMQASFTALSNVTQTVEERLTRWLLMCDDRVDGGEIPLTHEYLSIMLAVQRPSVTTALHVIEGKRMIRATRGSIAILDRPALLAVAGDAYGAPEAEYARLLGEFRRG